MGLTHNVFIPVRGRERENYRRVVDVRKEARGQSEAKKGPTN